MTPLIVKAVRLAGLDIDGLRARLTDWTGQLATLLSGNLLLGTHAACQLVTYTTNTTGSGPYTSKEKLQTRFTTTPAGVVIVRCVDGRSAPVLFPSYDWSWEDGRVAVTISQSAQTSPVTVTVLVVLG